MKFTAPLTNPFSWRLFLPHFDALMHVRQNIFPSFTMSQGKSLNQSSLTFLFRFGAVLFSDSARVSAPSACVGWFSSEVLGAGEADRAESDSRTLSSSSMISPPVLPVLLRDRVPVGFSHLCKDILPTKTSESESLGACAKKGGNASVPRYDPRWLRGTASATKTMRPR